jgi:hypothetical protein
MSSRPNGPKHEGSAPPGQDEPAPPPALEQTVLGVAPPTPVSPAAVSAQQSSAPPSSSSRAAGPASWKASLPAVASPDAVIVAAPVIAVSEGKSTPAAPELGGVPVMAHVGSDWAAAPSLPGAPQNAALRRDGPSSERTPSHGSPAPEPRAARPAAAARPESAALGLDRTALASDYLRSAREAALRATPRLGTDPSAVGHSGGGLAPPAPPAAAATAPGQVPGAVQAPPAARRTPPPLPASLLPSMGTVLEPGPGVRPPPVRPPAPAAAFSPGFEPVPAARTQLSDGVGSLAASAAQLSVDWSPADARRLRRLANTARPPAHAWRIALLGVSALALIAVGCAWLYFRGQLAQSSPARQEATFSNRPAPGPLSHSPPTPASAPATPTPALPTPAPPTPASALPPAAPLVSPVAAPPGIRPIQNEPRKAKHGAR